MVTDNSAKKCLEQLSAKQVTSVLEFLTVENIHIAPSLLSKVIMHYYWIFRNTLKNEVEPAKADVAIMETTNKNWRILINAKDARSITSASMSLADKASSLVKAVATTAANTVEAVVNKQPTQQKFSPEERLNICKQCPYFNGTRCLKCSCPMRAKVEFSGASCPIGKW